MVSLRRPAFALFVGLVVAVSAACGGSSSTPAPNTSVAPGATAAGATPAPVSTPAQGSDANSIITQALSGATDIKSFHIKLAVSGTIKGAALASATDATSKAPSDIKLDGTSLEGDIDVAKGAAHISFNVPPIGDQLPAALTGDIILVDQVAYAKISMLGEQYFKFPLDSLKGMTSMLPLPSVPVALPSAGAGLGDMTKQVEDLQKQLETAGAKAEVVGTDKIGGQDATHIKFTVPVDWINQQIAKQAASAGPKDMKLDSVAADMWVYPANNALAQLHLAAASSAVGNLDLMLTLTNYDKPVTVAPPAPSEISTANPLGGLGQ